MFAAIIQRTGKRALILAHRSELVHQARRRLAEFGINAEIEMADHRASTSRLYRRTIVATPQTLFSGSNGATRMQRFRPEDFDIVIADEAHHYVSPAYHGVLQYFRQHSSCKLLGVTATPDRADGEALSKIFESVAFNVEIVDGIDGGYLVPVKQQLVRIEGLDFSAVRTTAGDLNGADLARVMESEKTMQGVASATVEVAGDKRALIFTASVAQAEQLAGILNRHKAGAADWLHGGTPKELRADMLKRFAQGGSQYMVNCAVLTEGFDDPGIQCVIMAKPTKSRSLYAQMVGRGTRPLPGVDRHDTAEARRAAIAASDKPCVTVLDFVGNSGRHKLVTTADILGGKVSEEARDKAKKKIEEKGEAADIREELEAAELEALREIEEAKKRAAADKAHLVARAQYSLTYVDPFSAWQRQAAKWEGHRQSRLSQRQTDALLKAGFDPARMSLQDALAQHWELIRASDKQRAILTRYYPAEQVNKLPRWEAAKLLDGLAKNGWRKP
jgi:superfamily II DNA or RNA helicase